jgi:hypothetical protein
MTDQSLIELLEHAADRTPMRPAPLAEITRGARHRQQRRTAIAACGTLAVLAVVASLVLAPRLRTDGSGPAHQLVKHPKDRAPKPPKTLPMGPKAARLNGTWAVGSLIGTGGRNVLPEDLRWHMRLTFHNGRMTGSTTCNTITGRYVQSGPKGQDLRFLPRTLSTTLVGCSNEPPLMDALRNVRHLSWANNQHYLHAANWMILIALKPVGAS